jgi:hypothetical protein
MRFSAKKRLAIQMSWFHGMSHHIGISTAEETTLKSIRFMGRNLPMPRNMILRVLMGLAFVLGGIFSFLPVLGIWMIPLGLMILSIDFPPVRRFRRRATVALLGWFKRRFPSLAAKFGWI